MPDLALRNSAHLRKRSAAGPLILVAVGAILLAGNLLPGVDFSRFWPVILIALGLGMLVDHRR